MVNVKVFIDDSGSFDWHIPGRSVFCGISVADRVLPKLFVLFNQWKRDVVGIKKQKEVKGSELTDGQLTSFAEDVFLASNDVYLTVVGADTSATHRDITETVKTQSAETLHAMATLQREAGHAQLVQFYCEMAGWLRNRSPEQFLWVIALEETVLQSIQHTIIRFMEPSDDVEFEDWDIVIDEGFIRNQRHVSFWHDLLRSELMQSGKRKPLAVPDTWARRGHPWGRKHPKEQGWVDMSDLFRKHLYFEDSKNSDGLQLADICAHICFSFYKDGKKPHAAYSLLRPRIVGRDGVEITLKHIDERSLRVGPAAEQVQLYEPDDLRKWSEQVPKALK